MSYTSFPSSINPDQSSQHVERKNNLAKAQETKKQGENFLVLGFFALVIGIGLLVGGSNLSNHTAMVITATAGGITTVGALALSTLGMVYHDDRTFRSIVKTGHM